MASEHDEQLVHFIASLDGANGHDAAAVVARRFAIGSLLLTVAVAIASVITCARCPGGEVSHVAHTAGLRG